MMCYRSIAKYFQGETIMITYFKKDGWHLHRIIDLMTQIITRLLIPRMFSYKINSNNPNRRIRDQLKFSAVVLKVRIGIRMI